MKRLSLYLFLILFTLQAPSWADDITDFQIEGISLGDSLLNYFSEKEIEENIMTYYKNKAMTPLQFERLPTFKVYDGINVVYETGDKNYKIHEIAGTIDYHDNVKDCYKKMDEVVLDLSELFKNQKKIDQGTLPHPIDPSGKSTLTQVYFLFKSGDGVAVACYDFSKETKYLDHLRVDIASKKYWDFIETAY